MYFALNLELEFSMTSVHKNILICQHHEVLQLLRVMVCVRNIAI